jgi:hypothetical protein
MRYISQSEVGTWLSCQRRHEFSYGRQLAPVVKSEALGYGGAFHEALAVYYGDHGEPGWQSAIHKPFLIHDVAEEYMPDPEPGWMPESVTADDESVRYKRQRFLNHIGAYFAHYADEVFAEVAFVEYDFEIPLFYSKLYGLKGRLDGLVRDQTGHWWLFEHKTAATVDLDVLGGLAFDMQTMFYLLACRLLHKRYPKDFPEVQGVLYNVARKPLWRPKKVWDTILSTGEVFTGTKGAGSVWAKENIKAADEADYAETIVLAEQSERRETPDEYGLRCRESLLADPAAYFVRDWVMPNKVMVEDMVQVVRGVLRDIKRGPKYHNPRNCQFCSFRSLCGSPRETWDALVATEYTLKTPRPDVTVMVPKEARLTSTDMQK